MVDDLFTSARCIISKTKTTAMKKVHYLLVCLVILVGNVACKKGLKDDATTPVDPGTTANYSTKDVQVILPAGSTVDLTQTNAVSLTISSKVEANGNTKLAYNKGTNELAWVADKDNNVLLMGFITEDSNKISVATTAKVLLYYSLGTTFFPRQVRDVLVRDADKLTGFAEYQRRLEQLFIADPLVFQKGGFKDVLKPMVEQLIKQTTIDINARQILVENPTIRSGLQVAEYDFKNIEVSNYYRRRAHAFIYKTAYKDKNGNETILKQNISGADASMKDFRINPTSAIREVIGTSLDLMMGKGMDFAVSKSDPVELPLADAESEATYKVRIVGPGKPNLSVVFTNAEDKKHTEIMLEFFAMDIFLPVIMDVMGHKGLAEDMIGDKSLNMETLDPFIKLTGAAITATPSAYNNLKDGNYTDALSDFITAFRGNLAGQAPDIIKAVIDAGTKYATQKYANPQYFIDKSANAEGALKKITTVLSIADIILKMNDYRRLFNHIVASSTMEEWTVKAKENPIDLEPKEGSIPTLTDLNMQVYPKTTIAPGSSFEFDWYTTGKYGKLRDAVGHNAASFTSSVDKVIYKSTASSASLGDGGEETVIVTVYIKEGANRTKIGADTTIIKVKPVKHVINPEGITLSGKASNGAKSILLYIQRTDGVNDIQSNNVLDYKVEWNTAGKYGKFYGTMANATTEGNAVNYECLDDKTKEAVETITGKIFVRQKGAAAWTFFEEVKGSVKINNDDKKRILNLSVNQLHGDTITAGGTGYGCWKGLVASFTEDKDAKSYELMFYRTNGYSSQTYTWLAGQPSPSSPFSYAGPGYAGGVYTVSWGQGSWSVGPIGRDGVPGHIKDYVITGKAQLIIYLK